MLLHLPREDCMFADISAEKYDAVATPSEHCLAEAADA
jgi:hypothetical protein